jgi:hypothetical protein
MVKSNVCEMALRFAVQHGASLVPEGAGVRPRLGQSINRMFALHVIAKPDAIDRDNPDPVSFVDLIAIAKGIDVKG